MERKPSKKIKENCCWCGTEVEACLTVPEVEIIMKRGEYEEKIIAVEYCPTCNEINFVVRFDKELPMVGAPSGSPTSEGQQVPEGK